MSAETDAAKVAAAITAAGEPLTLTEAGHAARISRWRAFSGVRFGAAAEPPTLTWQRVGANWEIDVPAVVPPVEG